MHQNLPIAVLEAAEKTGDLIELKSVLQPNHLPYGALRKDGGCDILSVRAWWARRGIPLSRAGLEQALQSLDVPYNELLLFQCYGLSLTDHYWLTSCEQPKDWHSVNFFENEFSEDVGQALFGEQVQSKTADLHSPCNTANGALKKRWTLQGGERVLLKAGSGIYKQEPFSEVVAAELFRRLAIPHVNYVLQQHSGDIVCACPCFTGLEVEYVSAAEFLNSMPQREGVTNWTHFFHCVQQLQIPGAKEFMVQLLAADYCLANTDRHFGNFGALRDPVTLEWLGMAPAFDTGASLWHMTKTHAIDPNAFVPAAPFATSQREQLAIIAPYLYEAPLKLPTEMDVFCKKVMQQNPESDTGREDCIANAFADRIEQLHITQHRPMLAQPIEP